MKLKTVLIGTVIAIVAIVVLVLSSAIASQNTAINLEEQVESAQSAINVQEKRRVDLIYNYVDSVESYNKHEKETLVQLTEARTQAKGGNVEEAQMTIQAVAEAYPELKSQENYKTLMLELSTTENLIAEHRNNFNTQVKSYNKHVRSFPKTILLPMVGYEKKDYKYLDYNAPVDAPQNLFDRDKK